MYSVSKTPLKFSDIFFLNGWEFLVQIIELQIVLAYYSSYLR